MKTATIWNDWTLNFKKLSIFQLDDGENVFLKTEFLAFLGIQPNPKVASKIQLLSFLMLSELRPFIADDLVKDCMPVKFIAHKDQIKEGYKTGLLVHLHVLFEIVAKEISLTEHQQKIAQQCEIILLGLMQEYNVLRESEYKNKLN